MDTDTNTKLRFELWKLSTSLSVSTGKLVSHKQSKAGPCVALVITNSNEAAGSYGIGVVNETSRDKLPDTIKATPTAKYLKVEADSKVADHAAVFEGFEDFKGFYFDVLQKVSTDDKVSKLRLEIEAKVAHGDHVATVNFNGDKFNIKNPKEGVKHKHSTSVEWTEKNEKRGKEKVVAKGDVRLELEFLLADDVPS